VVVGKGSLGVRDLEHHQTTTGSRPGVLGGSASDVLRIPDLAGGTAVTGLISHDRDHESKRNGDYESKRGEFKISDVESGGEGTRVIPFATTDPFGLRSNESKEMADKIEAERLPEVNYVVTEEGCRPRVDRIHERVIIQNRSKKFEDGVLKEEGGCRDALEFYPIMKDYLCEGCTDSVNIGERRAYPRFQEYWFDRENIRHTIGDSVYTDTGKRYLFMDEAGCSPLIALGERRAYRQVETVYYNFNNMRKIVQECHRAPSLAPIPITETAEKCSLAHDFGRNISLEQKRLIFMIDGVEHEALGCQRVEPAIRHEFVETGCRPVVDVTGGSVTKMVRRRIRLASGFRMITDECEPEEVSRLVATREGCEGEYFHDLAGGRSYFKVRYFFPRGGSRKYVTSCLRSGESLAHQFEINGYENNDEARTSRPKLSVFIESPEQGRVIVDPPKIRDAAPAVAYTLVGNETRATAESYFEGCFRRIRTRSINLYNRGDGSKYEHIVGPAGPIAFTTDECSRTTDNRNEPIGYRRGNFWRHGKTTYAVQTRTTTTYPDGRVEPGAWVTVNTFTE